MAGLAGRSWALPHDPADRCLTDGSVAIDAAPIPLRGQTRRGQPSPASRFSVSAGSLRLASRIFWMPSPAPLLADGVGKGFRRGRPAVFAATRASSLAAWRAPRAAE